MPRVRDGAVPFGESISTFEPGSPRVFQSKAYVYRSTEDQVMNGRLAVSFLAAGLILGICVPGRQGLSTSVFESRAAEIPVLNTGSVPQNNPNVDNSCTCSCGINCGGSCSFDTGNCGAGSATTCVANCCASAPRPDPNACASQSSY